MSAVYLDSSALVKLAVQEAESDALRRHLLGSGPWVSSALARTEVLRALLPAGEVAIRSGREVLARCDLVRVSGRILDLAATLPPRHLRSLDAIHLATAEQIRGERTELATYDRRLAEAATSMGYRVIAPE